MCRWTSSLVHLSLQATTTFERLAVTSVLVIMAHHMQAFVSILEQDCALQNTLFMATALALADGNRSVSAVCIGTLLAA